MSALNELNLWDKNVEKAKRLLEVEEINKMPIAKLAYEAVTTAQDSRQFTYSEFARQTGIERSSLAHYVRAYRYLVKHNLPYKSFNQIRTIMSETSESRRIAQIAKNIETFLVTVDRDLVTELDRKRLSKVLQEANEWLKSF